MTILQAITRCDNRRHNGYSREEKVQWLSQLDGKVALLIHDAFDGEKHPFNGYDRSTPADTVLLIGKPFEEIYLYWLEAQICYADGEIADYNSAISQYNRLYGAYSLAYQKAHMPISRGNRFLF